jgi:hypothetical protein
MKEKRLFECSRLLAGRAGYVTTGRRGTRLSLLGINFTKTAAAGNAANLNNEIVGGN